MSHSLEAELAHLPKGDAAEEAARAQAQELIARGAPLIRETVDTPDPHLVSYLAVTDGRRLLLCDHRKSGLWLPPGGHVDPGETPRQTARRECREELGIEAEFVTKAPVFLTCQLTTGPNQHHDLSLWYLLRASEQSPIIWDAGEFHGIRWFDPLDIPAGRADPNLPRFVKKMRDLGYLPVLDQVS